MGRKPKDERPPEFVDPKLEALAARSDDKKLRHETMTRALRWRLNQVIEAKGYTYRSLCDAAGLADSIVSKIMKDGDTGRGANWDTIALIVRATGIDGHWFLTGEGSMDRTARVPLAPTAPPSSPPPPPARGQIVPTPSGRSPDTLVASDKNRRARRR